MLKNVVLQTINCKDFENLMNHRFREMLEKSLYVRDGLLVLRDLCFSDGLDHLMKL